MFKIIISPRAKRQLKLIPKQYKSVISLIIRELQDDPSYGKPLTKELTGRFTYKVGPYRIVYRINKKDKIVQVITAGHRSEVYK